MRVNRAARRVRPAAPRAARDPAARRTSRSGRPVPAVSDLARQLAALHYAVPSFSPTFGNDFQESVWAFQKVQGLERTGAVDAAFWSSSPTRGSRRPATGPANHIEVDKTRQVLYLVRNGKIALISPVATAGIAGYYTPEGRFAIYRKVTGWDHSPLGVLWNPMYFVGGYAIHGGDPVPPYPASHGCVRVPDFVISRLFYSEPYGETVIRLQLRRRLSLPSSSRSRAASSGRRSTRPAGRNGSSLAGRDRPGAGQALWPKSVTRSFWRQRQVDRYLARIFPRGAPSFPRIDYARRRLVLVAAGPRSSTGYGVEILRATEHRGAIQDRRPRGDAVARTEASSPKVTSPYRADHDPLDLETRVRTMARSAMRRTDLTRHPIPSSSSSASRSRTLDRAIVEAVNNRLELVAQIKAYKESQGLGFLDPEREE